MFELLKILFYDVLILIVGSHLVEDALSAGDFVQADVGFRRSLPGDVHLLSTNLVIDDDQIILGLLRATLVGMALGLFQSTASI